MRGEFPSVTTVTAVAAGRATRHRGGGRGAAPEDPGAALVEGAESERLVVLVGATLPLGLLPDG
eukprot:1189818-Prorocentrum_minimum.AAC.1